MEAQTPKSEVAHRELDRHEIKRLMNMGVDPKHPDAGIALACHQASPGFHARYKATAERIRPTVN